MSDMKTTLPDEDAMLERLKSVSDEPHIVEQFYPLIVKKHAGKSKYGVDVVLLLQSAIADCSLPEAMVLVLKPAIPLYLEALIDEPEVREEALYVYGEPVTQG